MKPIRLLPKAVNDIVEASEWYDTEREGLGAHFESNVEDTLERIRQNPALFPVYRGRTRRALVKTFPYGILFFQEDDEILVAAVLHHHRDPKVGSDR